MILLDDAQSTSSQPSSRLYEQAIQLWAIYPQSSHAQTIAAVDQCLQDINKALAQGDSSLFHAALHALVTGHFFWLRLVLFLTVPADLPS
jgi:hypothetical protein